MKLHELTKPVPKKLTQQTSVAAGKEPSLKLGTIGVTVGQSQSKGDTSRVREAVGFRMEPADREPAETTQGFKQRSQAEIRVSEVLRRVRLSSLSNKDERAIDKYLASKRPEEVLKRRDIDQMAAVLNLDVNTIRDLTGF